MIIFGNKIPDKLMSMYVKSGGVVLNETFVGKQPDAKPGEPARFTIKNCGIIGHLTIHFSGKQFKFSICNFLPLLQNIADGHTMAQLQETYELH
jgi:hypothetical protein